MAKYAFPFDDKPIYEESWKRMAQYWLATGVLKGVLNELQVYADSSGMLVRVNAGAAWIKGHYFESDVLETLSIASSDFTNPRIDRVVIRVDWTANTLDFAVLQGVPAVSPVAPALTQNIARWEIPLATVRVDAATLTVSADKIVDQRTFTKNVNVQPPSKLTMTLFNSWVVENGYVARYWKDELGVVHVDAFIKGGSVAAFTVISNLAAGYRPTANKERAVLCWTGSGTTLITARVRVETTGDIKIIENAGNGWMMLTFSFETF